MTRRCIEPGCDRRHQARGLCSHHYQKWVRDGRPDRNLPRGQPGGPLPSVVRPYSVLDTLGPYGGPCGLCGGPDARHRRADAIVEEVQAGEDPEFVADTHAVTLWVVESLVHHWVAE